MANQTHAEGFHPIRRDRLPLETVMDSYKAKGKLSEPAVCQDCGAVFQTGRWQWLAKPKDAHQTTCPACHRARDHFPAGYVTITGEFFAKHEQEIMQLIQHREAQEKAEHPLQRIMTIEKSKQGTLVTTTDIHLARGIGEALHHAYQGELEFHYNPDQNLLRVNWSR
jgi:NMD protein affecting ribosome stability and mRNA decay